MADDFQPIEPGEVVFRLDLTAAQLKVTHTALRSLLDDYGHDEQDVIAVIRTVLDKLPDEHSIRAIDLKHEAAREVESD
jgi:UDP-N-acetylmuramate-alanine ligase